MSFHEQVDQEIAAREEEIRNNYGMEPGLFAAGFHAGVAFALAHPL